MFKFIWNSWWRNKEKFILMLIGVLIVSIGLSYLVGVSQASNGTIVDELQKRWKSSYDIVVRPQDSRSVTEDLKLLEPNYLSGLGGGISLNQYEKIKNIPDVEIAAPIAMIGYTYNEAVMGKFLPEENGLYRITETETNNTGASKEKIISRSNYFKVGSWTFQGLGKEYGLVTFNGDLNYGTDSLIAGIDPEAEAKLVGIDQAVISSDTSRFFTKDDKAKVYSNDSFKETLAPIMLSDREYVDGKVAYKIEKLSLPFKSLKDQTATMKRVKQNGGAAFLDKQKGKIVDQQSFTTKQTQEKITQKIFQPQQEDSDNIARDSTLYITNTPSPLKYRPVSSPFRDRWPFAYEVEPFKLPTGTNYYRKQTYRPVNMLDFKDWIRIIPQVKGVYDPLKLKISKDPLSELPMETYFPAKAQQVMNQNGKPVNPPADMKPENNQYGYLTRPPMMLTTLDAAAKVLGDKPIAAIRIKVKGVDRIDENSQAVIRKVEKDIRQQTGLITDVTLGSSPQPALTHIPAIKDRQSPGWVQQPWIKIGASFTIFKEAKVGLTAVIGSVILVAIVYVFSSNLIMMYARKREFAVLLSLGWRPGALSKLLFIESTVLGILVSLVSWLILGWIYMTHHIETDAKRIILISLFGLLIYWLGTFIPSFLVRRIKPYESMKAGEISVQKRHFRAQSIVTLSLNYMLARWKRSVLSILSIAMPSSMLIFFLFITFRLKGVMYTSWLGQFVSIEAGPLQYLAMGIAFAISILTTLEIIWQNVVERQPEIAVMKSLGWRNGTVRGMILLEGCLNGLAAGIVGLAIALFMIWKVYGSFPGQELPLLSLLLFLPVFVGVLGASFPAEKAVRIQPYQGISGGYQNSEKTEKHFKIVFSASGILLAAGIISLLAAAIPHVQKSNEGVRAGTESEVTKGNVTATNGSANKKKETPKKEDDIIPFRAVKTLEEEWREGPLSKAILKTWKTVNLGDSVGYNPAESFGKKVKTPAGIPAAKKGNELITIPITNAGEGEDVGSSIYNPLSYKLIDETGKEYPNIYPKVLEEKNWRNFHFRNPGKVKVLLTFEVPRYCRHLLLYGQNPGLPGDIGVKVK
ncbi:FtsX-like permease family protein [Metabacillus sp. GX 13764]|uniref:ABC transporter permease n=1 Tax=Metabacillus kandeliae TaxID=2900151 RepID=UPI001E31542C|nr:FtsX-like permease family protein [Metabacillus kandeliae]MCD7035264.1 FtsX-like permease family protein [Metabacillus kandeliae]